MKRCCRTFCQQTWHIDATDKHMTVDIFSLVKSLSGLRLVTIGETIVEPEKTVEYPISEQINAEADKLAAGETRSDEYDIVPSTLYGLA